MAKPKISGLKVKSSGASKILKDAKVLRDMERRAQNIQRGCGAGYQAFSNMGPTRARASVVTVSRAAIEDNARNNTLLRNLQRGAR